MSPDTQPSVVACQAVGVVGTGMIGASMATLFIGNGFPVVMRGTGPASCQRGTASVHRNLEDLLQRGLMTQAQLGKCLALLHTTADYAHLADCDFVLEAVAEEPAAKGQVYGQLEAVCGAQTVIASATSSIPAGTLAPLLRDATRFLVAHPINPPHLVPLVEVVPWAHTSAAALERTRVLLETCGKTLLVLKKELDGFVINRLQHALFREALHLIDQGVCTAAEIDGAFLTSLGPRYASIGLFEHYDAAGLPLQKQVQERLFPTLCNATAAQRPLLEHLERGELGLSTRQGMLDWQEASLEDFRERQCAPFYAGLHYRLPE